MTPLARLLGQAITVAQIARPELTEAAIAEAAGIAQANFSRAKKACSPRTLAAALAGIEKLTGMQLDVNLMIVSDSADNKPTNTSRTS